MTLNDLDGDLDPEDNVHVTIDYRYFPVDQQEFTVVSTGNYRGTKRKIEATFRGISDVVGGSGIGHPTYYTPSNIKIEGDLTLSGVSLFTEQNILIPNPQYPRWFQGLQ